MEGLNLERDDLLCFTNILPASTKYCALQVSQQGFMSVKESKSKQFHKNKQINTKKRLLWRQWREDLMPGKEAQ